MSDVCLANRVPFCNRPKDLFIVMRLLLNCQIICLTKGADCLIDRAFNSCVEVT